MSWGAWVIRCHPTLASMAALYVLTLFSGCGESRNVAPHPSEPGDVVDTVVPDIPSDTAPVVPTPVADIMVEIQGAVSIPGVYRFQSGDRVHDAMEKAGGVAAGAEIRDLNIAARLMDESVLSVPYRQRQGQAAVATAAQLNPPAYTRSGWRGGAGGAQAAGAATENSAACVNLNTATQQELDELPGVGPKTAAKIMRYREQQPFTNAEELRNIPGIGDKKLASLLPLVCV